MTDALPWVSALLLGAARIAAGPHAAAGADPAPALMVLGAATALAGWLYGILAGERLGEGRRQLAAGLAFPVAALLLSPLAARAPVYPVGPAELAADGLLAGAAFVTLAKAGRSLAGQGRRDALLGWVTGVVGSGAILGLLIGALRAAAGVPPAPAAGVVPWGVAAFAAAAGFVFVRRQGWGTASLNLMFAMVPAFAGLLGVAEAAALTRGGSPEQAFGAGFLALVFVPVWLGAGLGFYLAGTLGGFLAMFRLGRRRDGD